MREQFPWFLDPTEEELQRLWEEATFCFDANVLLNLYRVDRETTEDYFKIFRELGDRIFLAHEAAKQFFHNRRGVIQTEQKSFSEAKEKVENWMKRRREFSNLKKQLRSGDGDNDIGDIIESEIKEEIENVLDDGEGYEEALAGVKDALIERIESLDESFTPTGTTRANAEEDEILEGLMDVFEGKTGSELDEDIDELKKEAQSRYEAEKPPGYKDYDGEDEVSRGECEDFLIWKQLMEFAEQEGEDVVFITGEEKYDWWEKDDDHNFVRPSHELLREFSRETGQVFWMFSAEHLIENAGERMGLDVKDKSVQQIETISNREMKMGRGRGYYLDEEKMEIQRIRQPIERARKECYKIKETIKDMKDSPNKDKEENLYRYLSLLESSITSISNRHDYLDEIKIDAIEMNLEEIKNRISDRNIDEAIELSENLQHYIDDITESMVAKIREVYG